MVGWRLLVAGRRVLAWPRGRRPGARGALRGCWGRGAPLIASRRYSCDGGTVTKRAAQAPGRRPLGPAGTRLHLWSSSDLMASSGVAVVTAKLYLALI